MQSFLCSVFHVFNPGKWNGLEIKSAYVARLFNSFPGVYWSPLYVEAFTRYERKTKVFHFPLFRFPLISRKRFHIQRRSIHPWKAIKKAGDIGWFDFQSVPLFTVENVKNGTCKIFYVPFSTILTLKNGTDWKLNQPMSLAFPIAF